MSQKVADDPRVSKLGAFLRKTSLDELPQLFNALSGELSLVVRGRSRSRSSIATEPKPRASSLSSLGSPACGRSTAAARRRTKSG